VDLRRLAIETELGRRVWNWWSHRRTAIYMLSYPKCGRTWLRLMIGKALVDHLQIDEDPMEIALLHGHDRRVPHMRVTHDDMPQLKTPAGVERDKSSYAGKDVIFLVRDPRDTMISYYFQATKRRGRFDGTPGEFLRHAVGSLDTILAYYNVWADHRHVPRSFTLVRYEDLHRDPVTELERTLRVIGCVPPRACLERAVEFSSFDNMRKLEQRGAVGALDRMKPADATDPESYKTRKGKVGGFREYLEPAEIEYMNARIRDRLSPFYREYLEPR
jgi:hypothetical protein